VQLAFEAHDGQKRRSGEPFIIHPVEVANILGELVSSARYLSLLEGSFLEKVIRSVISMWIWLTLVTTTNLEIFTVAWTF
jgi:hypothetical protein